MATLNKPDFILASASPRRAELLKQIGTNFCQKLVEIDEIVHEHETAESYVLRLAVEKASAVFDFDNPLPVLGSDTTVVLHNMMMGKPVDEEDAVAKLMALSGRVHQVLTGVAMVGENRRESRLSVSEVYFSVLTEEQCRRYWATGEPVDKAGAYAIQGKGAVFVKRISGSYSGVVGLPLAETRELLEIFNIGYWN